MVEFSKNYTLSIGPDNIREGKYHGILCLSDDSTDKDTFIFILDSVLSSGGLNNVDTINIIFRSLVNLFSVEKTQDNISEQKGLWAELFFMRKNGGFRRWAKSWHNEPTGIFDFSTETKRLEIKSTTRPERIHEFSHTQLLTMPHQETTIVSYLLQEDDTGRSLKTLIDEARSELFGNPHLIKLEKAIRRAGMAELDQDGPRFNEDYVNRHVAWFRSTEIPRFMTDEPPGVTGTHYKSDLTNAPKLSDQEIKSFILDFCIE